MKIISTIVLSCAAFSSFAYDISEIADSTNYDLVYDLDIPNNPSFLNGVDYSETHLGHESFSRIAYFLELDTQYIWISMDAFTTNVEYTGVPCHSCGQGDIQDDLNNVNVDSNVIGSGNGLAGNIEFWPNNYGSGDGGIYDDSDTRSNGGSYGSMQIHVDDPSGSDRITGFAFNHFNGGIADLGIGDRPTSHKDWTFANNAATYSYKNLKVYVCSHDCGESGVGAYGDPHIKTWTREQFDFHGICDLVLVSNAKFFRGAGLDVHIRTKKMRQWSYVDSAAIRIGTDILEVRGSEKSNFWINGIEGNGNTDKLSISEYPIQYYRISKKSEKFIVDLGNGEGIVFKTWNSFVSVKVENPKKDKFMGSVGLMGRFPEGTKIGRDNSIIEDINVFGQEWQVLSSEQNLFHDIEGPQHPQHCEIPSSTDMRRRLAEGILAVEDAEKACIGVGLEDKDLCIFDVMATNDKSSAGAY